MSADIQKLATFDGRIVQRAPVYAVQKGALSLTNAPFNAIAQTTSQHTYNIYVPSENVFLDRALEWASTVYLQMTVTTSTVLAAGDAIVTPGKDFALAAFPLNSLVSTLSATINDTTAVVNTQDVLYQVLRLADQKRNRLMRTCPTMLDKYLSYDDAILAVNNPIGGYDSQAGYDETPNGAFGNLVFTNQSGAVLEGALAGTPGAPVAVAAAASPTPYNAINGVPVAAAQVPIGTVYTIFLAFRSVEKLVLSPFVFADTHEMDTGFFGLNNIQLIMNLVSSPSRVVRSTGRYGRTISGVTYNSNPAQGPYQNSRVNCLFLTPSLDVPLPPKSVVPYMEFPRYLSNPQTIAAGETFQLQSQTITLPQIPDLLIIFARPTSYSAGEADWIFPVASSLVNDTSPLTVNFDNFSGLLSSTTAQQLYFMSVKNGLDMDWNTWSGRAHTSGGSYALTRQQGQIIPTVGGALVLKPGEDITLQSGQAPSLVGNFTLQFNLSVRNPTSAPRDAQLVVITVNSGFFESIRGSSRIIKGVLSEQDIISAPVAPMGSPALERMVGGFSFGSLANVISKAKRIYEQTKPVASAIASALPEEGKLGMIKKGMRAVGYGASGGLASGGGYSAGRRHKSLEERLM